MEEETVEDIRKKAIEAFNLSGEEEEEALKEDETKEQRARTIVYFNGFRDGIRELFPEVDMK